MKSLTYFLLLSCLVACKPVNVPMKKQVFKITVYDRSGDADSVTTSVDTIQSNEKINVNFYKKHFIGLSHLETLPDQLFDKNLVAKKIVEWANENEPHNGMNWNYTYTYNAKGQLVSVAYSGCLICNTMSWTCKLEYDNGGRLVGMYEQSPSFNNDPGTKTFQLLYDKDDNLIRVQHFFPDSTLDRQIELAS
jgi:hypothetical protein